MTSTAWQLAEDSARRYDRILVPAILGPAAQAVVERATVPKSRRIVDLGCGTGAAILRAARLAAGTAELIGIDNNQAMLSVARCAPAPEGRQIVYCAGNLVAMPLRDASCDLILCAQTLQFVVDYGAAAREMRRVLDPSGVAVIGLWCPVQENPYFASLIGAIETHIGERTAAGLKAIFNLSNGDTVAAILRAAGFKDISTAAVEVRTELGDLAEFVPRHIAATPMAASYAAASDASRRAVVEQMLREVGSTIGQVDDTPWFKTWVFMARP